MRNVRSSTTIVGSAHAPRHDRPPNYTYHVKLGNHTYFLLPGYEVMVHAVLDSNGLGFQAA